MTYSNHQQLKEDIRYIKLVTSNLNRLERFDSYMGPSERISYKDVIKLEQLWAQRVKTKFEETKKQKSKFANFLNKYSLSMKEVNCLIDLIDNDIDKTDFEKMNFTKEVFDVFKRHKIRYESSALKRHKLVFRITDPLRPMRTMYEVAYKAQLEIVGKTYSDEYQQLDMALEEESKRNSPEQLDSLYYSINPTKNFNDLIVSDNLKETLKTAINRETQKEKIMKTWGIGKVIEYGKGTTLNFRGPPGTGKTLSANVLAKELNKKLLMIRYDQLQSMWVGQTEKNIQRAFAIAKTKNAVLFFDEADAIATNRATHKTTFETSQVNVLLKELEKFEGVCIFATNFGDKFDPAFERRLTMHIDFELPTTEQARKIIEVTLPKKAIDKNLNLNELDIGGLSGGDIKNIVLNAAGIAAKENANKIGLKHLQEAVNIAKKTKLDETEKQIYHG